MMTYEEFRSDKELLKWMRDLTQTTHFQLALEAMRSIDPVRFTTDPDVTPHYAHVQLGNQTGWAQYERQFLLLARPITKNEPLPEPDYSEEPEPAEEP